MQATFNNFFIIVYGNFSFFTQAIFIGLLYWLTLSLIYTVGFGLL